MKKLKRFWPPFALVLALVVYFDIELINYILASKEADRRSICRANTTLFVSEFLQLRTGMADTAARIVAGGESMLDKEFLDQMAIHQRLASCRLMPERDAWICYRLVPSPVAAGDEVILKSAGQAHFLPAEAEVLSRLMEAFSRLARLEHEAVMAARAPPGEAGQPWLDRNALGKNRSYQESAREFGILSKDFKALVLEGNRLSQLRMTEDAAGHLRWVVRLGLIQTGLLAGMLWLGRRRLTHVERRAYHDALTDLPNRWQLNMYLKWVCSRAEAHGEAVILAFIDLNGFKPINDIFGHERGDDVLRHVADRLKENCRANDMVARFGGDEFVVVFVSAANQRHQGLARLRKLMHATFDEPCELGRGLALGAAVGISLFPSRASTLESLIETADQAMYEAKRQAKDGCEPLIMVEYQRPLSGGGIPFDVSGSRC